MKWIKKGVIFAPDHNYDWMVSHASVPVVDEVRDGVLRIYFGTRDQNGRSHTSYIEVEAALPETTFSTYTISRCFHTAIRERSTIAGSCLHGSSIRENRKYLYYIGWNPQVTVPYRLAIGLAVSEDGGQSFQKVSEGPVCDRSVDEPFFNTAPCVLREGDQWRMWYVSCTGWVAGSDGLEPRYHVKYAESVDGVSWQKTGRVCIDYDEEHGCHRPPVRV